MTMKLGSYIHQGIASYGARMADGIVDLGRRLGSDYPDLLSLLLGDGLEAALGATQGQAADFGEDAVRFTPLIPAPVNIFCAGVNYLDHIEEMGRERPQYPTLFMKLAQSLVGHGQPLIKPRLSDCFDYEAELAVVIGKGGRHITQADWRAHVAGFTCLMDGSIRDFQARAVDQGKNFHRASACGPWMVTLDEAPEAAEMHIEGRLNGSVMQRSSIDKLVFGVAELVAYYSQIARLEPGDIISTGTPGGVGHGRTPPLYMKAGDVFEVEIAGVGLLRNPVLDE
jgi:2-keto-4-pentenoate hydratase/2-oxohepta-3-ene-1,7-dioic acid hydratase in catechol pathway